LTSRDQAIHHFKEALRIKPDDKQAAYYLECAKRLADK